MQDRAHNTRLPRSGSLAAAFVMTYCMLRMLTVVAVPDGIGDSGSHCVLRCIHWCPSHKIHRDGAVSYLQLSSQRPSSLFRSNTSTAMASTTMSRVLAGTPLATSSTPRRAARSAPAPSQPVTAAFFRPAFRQQRPRPAQRCGPRQACGPAGFSLGAGPMGFRGMVNGRPMSAEEMMRVRAELVLVFAVLHTAPVCCRSAVLTCALLSAGPSHGCLKRRWQPAT